MLDLRSLPGDTTVGPYDVCVVGAGAAGLYLAARLAAMGTRVAILEAGGEECAPGESIGISARFLADPYGAVGSGRSFGIGGTTSTWGGQLLPYSFLDERSALPHSNVWSHVIGIVQRHSRSVEAALGLGHRGDYFALAQTYLNDKLQFLSDADFAVVVSDWLPFRRRNLRFLVCAPNHAEGALDIYSNAVASSWQIEQAPGDTAAIKAVFARSINGREMRLYATTFVIAAGAIESARILLEMTAETGGQSAQSRRAIGRRLSDHLSVPIATVNPADRTRVAQLFGARFLLGRMRTFRFVDKREMQSSPRAFFHFSFLQENPGFHLARRLLGGIQARRLPKVSVSEFLGGVRGLGGLAYHRYVRNRLFIPKGTPVQVQLDIEQTPSIENCMSLSKDLDAYGRATLNVCWRASTQDYENLKIASKEFLRRWPTTSLGLSPLEPVESFAPGAKLYDSFHPVGVCRMGDDDEAVVNLELQVHGMSNVFVVSTGVFPSAGTANPTFTLLCLAEALAEHLAAARP